MPECLKQAMLSFPTLHPLPLFLQSVHPLPTIFQKLCQQCLPFPFQSSCTSLSSSPVRPKECPSQQDGGHGKRRNQDRSKQFHNDFCRYRKLNTNLCIYKWTSTHREMRTANSKFFIVSGTNPSYPATECLLIYHIKCVIFLYHI